MTSYYKVLSRQGRLLVSAVVPDDLAIIYTPLRWTQGKVISGVYTLCYVFTNLDAALDFSKKVNHPEVWLCDVRWLCRRIPRAATKWEHVQRFWDLLINRHYCSRYSYYWNPAPEGTAWAREILLIKKVA